MNLKTVQQLQAINIIMSDQFCRYQIYTLMIFGVAGGNGLNHVDISNIKRVYGVDINGEY